MKKYAEELLSTMTQLEEKYTSLQKSHLVNDEVQKQITNLESKMKKVKKSLENLDVIKRFWSNKVQSLYSH